MSIATYDFTLATLGAIIHRRACRGLSIAVNTTQRDESVDVAVAFKWNVSRFDVVRIRQSLLDGSGRTPAGTANEGSEADKNTSAEATCGEDGRSPTADVLELRPRGSSWKSAAPRYWHRAAALRKHDCIMEWRCLGDRGRSANRRSRSLKHSQAAQQQPLRTAEADTHQPLRFRKVRERGAPRRPVSGCDLDRWRLRVVPAHVLIGVLDVPRADSVLSIANLAPCAGYIYLASGPVYGASGKLRGAKALLLALAVAAIVLGYRFALFLITLYTT